MHSPSLASLAFLAIAACVPSHVSAPTPVPAPSPSQPVAASDSITNDVKWVHMSAEYRALTQQVYAMASEKLPELARGLPAQGWAIIMDSDETALDNSEYQRRLSVTHAPFDPKSWTAWVNERAATAVPGAPEFTNRVHALGGRVVVVTNRSQVECDPTRENLKSVGVEADMVLCQPKGEPNKNLRFQRVQNGTAMPGMPAMSVVEWLGDNIQDFPNLTQAARGDTAALAQFGRRFFMLPNPMYGSWEKLH